MEMKETTELKARGNEDRGEKKKEGMKSLGMIRRNRVTR